MKRAAKIFPAGARRPYQHRPAANYRNRRL